MRNRLINVLIGSAVCGVAYKIMPDGPWYREIGSALLLILVGRWQGSRLR